MKYPEAHNEKEWFDERVEPFLDGVLEESEHLQMERLLEEKPAYEKEVAAARQLNHLFKQIEAPDCPDYISRNVIQQARQDSVRRWKNRFWNKILAPAWKPAIAATLLVTAIWFVLQLNPATMNPAMQEPVTDQQTAEVDQALNEIKFALGYVSKVGREAGASVNLAIDPLRSNDGEE